MSATSAVSMSTAASGLVLPPGATTLSPTPPKKRHRPTTQPEATQPSVSLSSPRWPAELGCSLLRLRESALYCDVVIAAATGGTTFSAHAAVLAAASPVLAEYMQETGLFVKLAELAGETWTLLLRFMYTGSVSVCPGSLPALYEAASRLRMDALCSLIDDITPPPPPLGRDDITPPGRDAQASPGGDSRGDTVGPQEEKTAVAMETHPHQQVEFAPVDPVTEAGEADDPDDTPTLAPDSLVAASAAVKQEEDTGLAPAPSGVKRGRRGRPRKTDEVKWGHERPRKTEEVKPGRGRPRKTPYPVKKVAKKRASETATASITSRLETRDWPVVDDGRCEMENDDDGRDHDTAVAASSAGLTVTQWRVSADNDCPDDDCAENDCPDGGSEEGDCADDSDWEEERKPQKAGREVEAAGDGEGETVRAIQRQVKLRLCPTTGQKRAHSKLVVVRVTRDQVTHQCADCEHYFFNAAELSRHLRSRSHCTVPPEKASLPASVARYVVSPVSMATPRPPLTCRVCGAEFPTRRDTRTHIAREHPHVTMHNSLFRIVCHLCNKNLQSFYFDRHLWKEHQLRGRPDLLTLACPECGFRACSGDAMTEHVGKVHRGVKAVVCEVCGREFGDVYELRWHAKMHTGEKNYQCKFCDETFRKSSHLVQHISIHTGWKPYRCNLCDKAFTQLTSVNLHLKTHHPSVDKAAWRQHRTYTQDPVMRPGSHTYKIDPSRQ